ncbi:MarR family winged helix-turn-helix transcriptional regulator [Amycolatopsis rubida]|uniref:DNA-binding transcriptional regulator, MarR family n=1 Tax=Amycolatopsis rubida TaxID=112413 RepID=A0A1I5U3V1_9PSEU|nr:MarR family winged helix-turn-helix transcriptional regulator [Amycolatopsis rubida]SFP89939.1 DNA-binding transcriptional regulator, MarR family [Amycolatopsis rubida]
MEQPSEPLDVLERATAVLVRNFEMLRRRTDVYAELDQAEYLILRTLDELGPADIGTLAGALGLDPSTAGRQVSAMLRKELAERSPAGDDRRRCVITPTGHGRELMHRTRTRRRSSVAELLNDWSPDEVQAFAGLLTRYNSAVTRRYLGD